MSDIEKACLAWAQSNSVEYRSRNVSHLVAFVREQVEKETQILQNKLATCQRRHEQNPRVDRARAERAEARIAKLEKVAECARNLEDFARETAHCQDIARVLESGDADTAPKRHWRGHREDIIGACDDVKTALSALDTPSPPGSEGRR